MTQTKTEASLLEALRQGNARYKDPSVPWRVRQGVPQVGVPNRKADGAPGKRLNWEEIPETVAKAKWFQTGWILE